MSYGTILQFRAIMSQVGAGTVQDDLIQEYLDRATAVVEGELGFQFAGYASSATAKRFDGGGGTRLYLPYYQSGTLTSIAPVSGLTTMTAYTLATDYEVDPNDHTCLYCPSEWPRQRYEATAKWGYGSAPADVVEVTLEIAVNLWRGRDRGMFSDVIGVEGGGAVGYQRALTNMQRMTLNATRRNYLGVLAG